MNDDINKYKDAYLSEARTHVKDMNLTLVEWKKHPNTKKHLQDVFRMDHTLKSISAAMGYHKISELCHTIEDLLDAIRNHTVKVKDGVNVLFSTFDFLVQTLNAVEVNTPELDPKPHQKKIENIISKKVGVHELPIAPNLTIESITTIEVKVERLDKFLNLTKELLVNKMRLETLSEDIQSSELTTTVDIMNRTISELQYHVMQIRLVPIGFIFDRFTRMVRDIAKQQHKDIDLKTNGREIEIDRSLIDGISELDFGQNRMNKPSSSLV